MNVLTPHQRELIHREMDGETTPEESVQVGELVAAQPEALALMASLRELDAIFRKVPDHAPPPGLRPLIHQAMSSTATRSRRTGRTHGNTPAVSRWIVQQWNSVRNLTEELMQTKTVLIGAAAAIAVVAVIGHFTVGYPPSVFDAGTIGASDSIVGVQQAGRYRGRTMTDADVSLSNPEVQALFQDDKVLKLVQSDVFRTIMRDESFRALQTNAAYQALQKDADYAALQKDAAYAALQKDAAYMALQKDAAWQALQSNAEYQQLSRDETFRMLQAKGVDRQALEKDAAYTALQKDAAYMALQKNAAWQALQKNAAWQALQKNAAWQALQSNAAYMALQKNAAYQALQSDNAFRMLQATETFRMLARDQAASEAFLTQAMRMEL